MCFTLFNRLAPSLVTTNLVSCQKVVPHRRVTSGQVSQLAGRTGYEVPSLTSLKDLQYSPEITFPMLSQLTVIVRSLVFLGKHEHFQREPTLSLILF